MEKRIIGFILTLAGVVGLVLGAYYFLHGGTSNFAAKEIAIYGILGIIFFMAGIGLIRNTKDKPT